MPATASGCGSTEFHAGRLALESEQVQDGLRYGEKCVELAPQWAAGYYVRGHAFLALEAWEQAESDFARAAELRDTMCDAWLRLARIRAHLQKTDLALNAVNEALECDPYHPDALALRIELLPQVPRASEQAEEVMSRIDRDLKMAHKYGPPHPFFLTRRAEHSAACWRPGTDHRRLRCGPIVGRAECLRARIAWRRSPGAGRDRIRPTLI